MSHPPAHLRSGRSLRFCPAWLAALPVLGGCTVHPARLQVTPGVQISAYAAPEAHGTDGAAPAAWWSLLDSVRLDAYVRLALQQSHELAAARARLAQAEALRRRAAAQQGPGVDASGRAEHDTKGEPRREEYRELGAALSWELDFFGRLRSIRLTRALEAESRRQQLAVLRLAISASVAEAYLGVIEQKELLRLLRSQIASSEEMLGIIEGRFKQGLISRVDLLQQQGQLADIRSLIPDAEAALCVQQHILDTLVLGRSGDVEALPADDTLPVAAPLPRLGNPAELLVRRPDLRAASADVRAADADVGRALAERLPRLSFSADALVADGRGRTGVWSTLGADAVLPLLDWGGRRAEVGRTRAVLEERLAIFDQLYVDAVLEVDNAVVREVKQKELLARLEERRRLLQAAVEQSKERYTTGITDYLPVLTSLQQMNALEQRMVRERRKLLSMRVTLHRVLGGPMPEAETIGRVRG